MITSLTLTGEMLSGLTTSHHESNDLSSVLREPGDGHHGYHEEDDVIRNAIEEAVCEGEDRDGGVQAEVGEEGSQGPQHTANYQTQSITE